MFKVTNNTYVCEFHFNIININVGAGGHIKTLKMNEVYLPQKEIIRKSTIQETPGKRHFITEFINHKQKKLTPGKT